MAKVKKNYAKAITKPGNGPWYDWLESEEGKQAAEPNIFLIGHDRSQYLENRLWRAFSAGMKAGFEQAQGEVKHGE